jgi:molybdate transport system permease protein
VRRRRAGRRAVVLGWLLAAVLGLPVVVVVVRAVAGPAFRNPGAAVSDALILSLSTTAISIVITVAIGLPIAFTLARRSPPGRALLETIVDLPIVLPPSVAGLALLLVFGRRGVVGEPLEQLTGATIPFTAAAVVLAQTFVSAPFFIRAARAGIGAVDRELEDAARVDGAGERDVLRWVTLPLAAPALAAGLAMSWARALGEFGATILFAGNIAGRTQTLPLVVYGEFQSGDLDAASAAAAILVLAAVVVLVAVRVLDWGRLLELRPGGAGGPDRDEPGSADRGGVRSGEWGSSSIG